MGSFNWKVGAAFLLGLVISSVPISNGVTDTRDVFAIHSLYESFQFPKLRGWSGSDPCGENWEGVQCVFANVTAIILSGANLSGQLADGLQYFSSIMKIDLTNNNIGGNIPSNLPPTLEEFFLSGNKLRGSIPTLASLTSLSNLSISNNLLTGEIPDTFQQLTGLTYLDLSGNNLSGQLPPSLGNLSSLTTLCLQNNRLTGVLDVIQNLPLLELNIENNLFSGPIPENLFRIPNFRKEGNPFNTTVLPSPPVSSPSSSPAPMPVASSALTPALSPALPSPSYPSWTPFSAHGPSAYKSQKTLLTKRIFWLAIGAVLLLLLIAVCLLLSTSRYCGRRSMVNVTAKRHGMAVPEDRKPTYSSNVLEPSYQFGKVPREAVVNPQDGYGLDCGRRLDVKTQPGKGGSSKRMASASASKNDQAIDTMTPSLPLPPAARPRGATEMSHERRTGLNSANSIRSFTIASLQQITNRFSEDNFIGSATLGIVYKAKLPNGKLLAVKKLHTGALGQLDDDEFLQLVSRISKLKHDNVLEVVGYCSENGQRLLVYEYCRNGTLYDALNTNAVMHRKLSWNARVQIALGAAKALKYLHTCQLPTVHQNFTSCNVLLDDELSAHVSDCGVALVAASGSDIELPEYGYGAPECEVGIYTQHSDVYSFGIVMLELLTGRKAYDRSRPRCEQFLVRWAIPQLHDIDALSRMVDPSLSGGYPSKSLSRFADIISLCLQGEPEFRPPMSEIVQDLLHLVGRQP